MSWNPPMISYSLPNVGHTRCYWALLSPDLLFLYTDPVLSSHLDQQADLLIGRSLLDFVHPDEQASARQDLAAVLDSRTMHGSVTRVRYSRLSRVRRQLGHQGPVHSWPDADKVAVDANYMAVDIVINWAADGLVLCFIHAVVDLAPSDNDEHHKTTWTNWCHTPPISLDQVNLLYHRLSAHFLPRPTRALPWRVFQIISTASGPGYPPGQLLVQWPADLHSAVDLAKLAADVHANNGPHPTDAKTSCTRRFKSQQRIHLGHADGTKDVESIFIPHGAVVFACHKVSAPSRLPSSPPTLPAEPTAAAAAPMHQHHIAYSPPPPPHTYVPSHFYDQTGSYGLPSPSYYIPPQSQFSASSSAAPPQNWTSASSPSQYASWPSSPGQAHTYPHHPTPFPENSYTDNDNSMSPRKHSPDYLQSQYDANIISPISPSLSTSVPIPVPGMSSTSANKRRTSPTSTRDQYGSGGRSAGNPPLGIQRCVSCKVGTSPEWRKGPSGKKDLCNACGLRYARSRAKKEGVAVQRRRKDKTCPPGSSKDKEASSSSFLQDNDNNSPSSSSAALSLSLSTSPVLKKYEYDDAMLNAIDANSPNSASGSEGGPYPSYHHHHPPHADYKSQSSARFENLTPSPSPPASASGSMQSFAHHQNHHPHRQSSYHALHTHTHAQSDTRSTVASTSGDFFPPPPAPLQHPHPYSPGTAAGTGSSPASSSPLTSFASVHSFQRDQHPPTSRDWLRDSMGSVSEGNDGAGGFEAGGAGTVASQLPPTPVSAESPRHVRRL